MPESLFGDKSQVQKKFFLFMRHVSYLLFTKIIYIHNNYLKKK